MFYRNLADKMNHISETAETFNFLLQKIKRQAEKGKFALYETYDKRAYFEILPVVIDRLEENSFEVTYKETIRNISEKIIITVKWDSPKCEILPFDDDITN